MLRNFFIFRIKGEGSCPKSIRKVSRNEPRTAYYYMAVSHKDWELPNSRIWLAEIDIDRGLDFPI